MIRVQLPKSGFRGTKLPWYDHPFRLISWLEMNKFSAEHFLRTGSFLGNTVQALEMTEKKGIAFHDMTPANIISWLGNIHKSCNEICLTQSTKSAARIITDMGADRGVGIAELRVRLEELRNLIGSEMDSHLFLWVPSHRAEWYSRDAEAIIGAECCARFKSVQRELEEAAKSYAVGRYTASAFHLMRSTEAGVKALGKAIGYTPPNGMWELVFKHVQAEFHMKPSLRPAHWQTHGDFLETVWADLRAVSKAWRNDIAHLVDTYSEDEAKDLLAAIPMFLRDLATKMDENGKLY